MPVNMDTPVNIVTASEMRRLSDAHARAFHGTYRKVLAFLSETLRSKAASGHTSCNLVVPPIIFGLPAYDVTSCCAYIRTQLERRGFRVSEIDDDQIFVEWGETGDE